jgi:predicted dehydrogenase
MLAIFCVTLVGSNRRASSEPPKGFAQDLPQPQNRHAFDYPSLADPQGFVETAMPNPLKLAFVGCGAIAQWHRHAVEAVAEVRITAAIDVDPAKAEAMAKATGGAPFASLEAGLAAGGFEAVLLMLPHHLHESAALTALEAGVHVMLEKPMATELDACNRILAAASRAPGVFMVAENAQYWPEIEIASEAIAAGAIGEIVTARVQLFFPPMPQFYGGEKAWRLDSHSAGGGLSIDTGSHYIRPLRLWLGEVDEVVAAMEHPFPGMQGESLARSLFRFESGVVASFDLLLTAGAIAPQEIFRITGREGEITIGAGVTLYDAANRRGQKLDENRPQGYMASYQGQIADFARAIASGEPLAASAEYSLGEVRTALAMARSAKTKRWEKVWD